MKKSIQTLAMLLVLVMCLAACAPQTPATEPAAPVAEPAAPAVEPSDPATESEAPAVEELDWPKKDITVIVPFNPGGDTDINARLYVDRLSDLLGVNVVCQNISGNGGATGATQAYKSANDGNTVLFYHTALVTNYVCEATEFGVDGFEIACIAGMNAGNVICVNGQSPYNTLAELIEASKTENITFAANAGATTYWMGALLNNAGANFNLVDMGGAAERVTALLGNQVTAIPNPVGTTQQYLESGDFKALALLEADRNSTYADIPTAVEQGVDVACPIYYFFAFPKGTDPGIVEKFSAAVKQVNETTEYAEALEQSGYAQAVYYEDSATASSTLMAQQEDQLAISDILNP